jgi:hypothetical protein
MPEPRGTEVLVPCFALVGGDLERPGDPPLVVQLIERLRADPTRFLVDHIMVPIVECWALAARRGGILLESHAQNTLLELGADFRPRRIVHRDCDVWIDREARQDLGLSMPFIDAQIGAGSGRTRAPYYSLVYDRFVGHGFFDYLLAATSRFHAIDHDAIHRRVIEAFRCAFPDAEQRFPARTMFYFSDAVQPDDHVALIDLKQPPEWR